MAKKTAAQLQREIDAALARKPKRPPKDRAHAKPTRLTHRLHHSTKQSSPRQEEILMIANDAALEGDVTRALKVLSQGKQRKITTSLHRTTPDPELEARARRWYDPVGGVSKTEWIDKKGDPIKVDKDDIQKALDDGHHDPVMEAIARAAVEWLENNHSRYFSSNTLFLPPWDPIANSYVSRPGTLDDEPRWYSTMYKIVDYSTGEQEEQHFHLENFTEAEERRIHEYAVRRRLVHHSRPR